MIYVETLSQAARSLPPSRANLGRSESFVRTCRLSLPALLIAVACVVSTSAQSSQTSEVWNVVKSPTAPSAKGSAILLLKATSFSQPSHSRQRTRGQSRPSRTGLAVPFQRWNSKQLIRSVGASRQRTGPPKCRTVCPE
jgi:hypothetical protein